MAKKFNIPYGRHTIDQKDIDAVVDTLKSDFLTQGPKINQFEIEFAKYVGANYAVAVSNATAGLHISCLSLGLKPGQRVITTPISFAATANCISYCGGEVWFVDIDPETYLISIDKVKELIESKPKGFFTGIIPVNFAGLSVDFEQLNNITSKNDMWIIEDACHSPGGFFIDSKEYKQICGNSIYSDLSVFSFHPVKHIACGEGGMVCTNSEELYKKLLLLRSHGITKDNMIENHGGWYYEMQDLGFNYRMTDIQAALGVTQLLKNKIGVTRRNQIANRYKTAFEGKVKYQKTPNNFYHAYHLFVIEVDDRLGLYNYLKENNIFAQIHYIPIHKLPYYSQRSNISAELNNAELYYSNCISLPMYPSLTDAEQQFVIDKVLTYCHS